MSGLFEPAAQYERDLRGANKESKRAKDSRIKWRYGATNSNDCSHLYCNCFAKVLESSESQPAQKLVPRGRFAQQQTHKRMPNVVKINRPGRYNCERAPRVKVAASAHEEMEAGRDMADLPSPGAISPSQQMSFSDHILYSFDRSETPGRPLTLDVFVKEPTTRDTERLVEKEYEIVDENGQSLKGRAARRNLRKSASNLADGDDAVDESGFELV